MASVEDESDPRQLALSIGRYANFFKVGHNAFEIVLEFGEKFTDDAVAQMHTRIVTNPVYAQALLGTLNESLRTYETTYGTKPIGNGSAESAGPTESST
jgi:Protein of unknown function (DUF3467)